MKVIIVTGTPGTGKTLVAKKLAKQKGYKFIDVKRFIRKLKLTKGYDKKRKSFIVDMDKLIKTLIATILVAKAHNLKGLVLDSHLAHYLPKKYVDLCIITRTEPKKLYKRLKQRGYSKEKIKENMEAEIMQIILEEARHLKHKIKVIKT